MPPLDLVTQKVRTKSNLERKGLFCLTLPGNSPSLREVKAETQAGPESRGGSSSRRHGGRLLTDWLVLYGLLSCLLIAHSTTIPGAVTWALHLNRQPKTIPQVSLQASLEGHFLNWGSLFQNDSSLCQIVKKLASTVLLMVSFLQFLTQSSYGYCWRCLCR